MKNKFLASCVLSKARITTFMNMKTKQPFIIIATDDGEMNLSLLNGRELAMLLKTIAKTFAAYYSRAKPDPNEVIEVTMYHANVGANEALFDHPIQKKLPVQTTLEGML